MKVIYNKLIPFKGFCAINLFGIIFARKEYKGRISDITINHESIHSAQMRELGYIFFYIFYFFEWLYRLVTARGYYDISFEKEAYENEGSKDYLSTRKPYAMWRK